MTISWTSLSLSILGFRSRSQWLFLEKHFVITLVPLFINGFLFYIIQVFSMTISWKSLSLSVLGPRSRSQRLFLEKHCHRSSALIYYPISMLLHTSIGYDYTSNKFAFQHDRVKVAVTIFRKTLQLKACQASKGLKPY